MSADVNPAVPAAVWEQDMPVGGADTSGRLPRVAAPVVVAGIVTVREVPALAQTSASFPLTTTGRPVHIPYDNRRRRLILSVDYNVIPGAYVCVADNEQQAVGGFGLHIPHSTVIVLAGAADMYVQAFGADLNVSWLSELDKG